MSKSRISITIDVNLTPHFYINPHNSIGSALYQSHVDNLKAYAINLKAHN